MVVFDYIPASRRANLWNYRYSGIDKSLLSKHLLGPYWTWLVSLFPTSIAPNTITLSGLVLVALNLANLFFYDASLQNGTNSQEVKIVSLPQAITEYTARGGVPPVRPLWKNFGVPKSVITAEPANGWSLSSLLSGGGGASPVPVWLYLTFSLGLFMYQSLDSIDGKQARRTGMAGPLGEMFDHGCDAVNTTLECILCCQALNVGRSYWAVMSMVATLSNFYLTTWEEYHTGTLFLSVFNGPVEGILLICVVYVITALTGGPAFWDRGLLDVTQLHRLELVQSSPTLLRLNFSLNETFLALSGAALLVNVMASYANVSKSRRERGETAITAVTGLVPFVVQAFAISFWLTANDSQIVADPYAFLPFLLFWGLAFAYNVGLMITAHVTQAPFPYWNAMLVWICLGAIDARVGLLQTSPQAIRYTVYGSLAAAALLYVDFAHYVVTTITTEFGTACFKVIPPKTRPDSPVPNGNVAATPSEPNGLKDGVTATGIAATASKAHKRA